MIQPINRHIIIEPLKHQTYLPTEKGTYDEVGIVLEAGQGSNDAMGHPLLRKGDKVWFDCWLGSKHPTGKDDEYFWLIKFDDIKAVEHQDGTDSIPE